MGDDARDCGKWNRGNFSEMDFGTDLDLNDKGGLGGRGENTGTTLSLRKGLPIWGEPVYRKGLRAVFPTTQKLT